MKRNIAIAAMLLSLLTACYVIFFHESDRRAVLGRFDAVLGNIEKNAGEGNFAMLAKHQALSALVAEHIRAECANPHVIVDDAADIVLSQYAQARQFAQSITLSANHVEVAFPEKDTAVLSCYGTAVIKTRSGQTFEESRPVIVTFIKKDGKWLLAEAREKTVFK